MWHTVSVWDHHHSMDWKWRTLFEVRSKIMKIDIRVDRFHLLQLQGVFGWHDFRDLEKQALCCYFYLSEFQGYKAIVMFLALLFSRLFLAMHIPVNSAKIILRGHGSVLTEDPIY